MAARTPYFFFVYKDSKGEYRWRFYAPNNRIMANSGEGYKNKADCISAINTICRETTSGLTIEDDESAAA